MVFGVDQPRLFWWFFILFMSTLNNRAIKLVLVSEKEGIRKCSFEFCYYRISLLFSQTHYFGEIKLLPSIIWNRSNLILNETGFHLYFLPMLAQKVQKQQKITSHETPCNIDHSVSLILLERCMLGKQSSCLIMTSHTKISVILQNH